MPQLHFYVPDAVARQLRARAHALGLSVSRYLAVVIAGEIVKEWPRGFFDDVVGGWQGKTLRRVPQGKLEKRELL